MRVQYGTAVFGVELGSDKPFQGGYLYYLHQVRFRIDARTLHAGRFILCLICVVELIAVAVALLYVFRAIGLVGFAAFLQYAFVSAQTHRAAHIGNGLLLFHDVDNVVRCLFIHFARIGICVSQYVAGKFNGNALHAQADTECRNIVRTRIFDGYELSGNATFAETRSDENARHAFQCFRYVFVRQLLAVYEIYGYLAVIVCSGL